jgi:hypothetical protein
VDEERSSKPVDHTRRGWHELPRHRDLTPDQWRTLRRQLNAIDEKLHQLSMAESEPRRR